VVVVASGGAPPRNMVPWLADVHLKNLDVLLVVHVPLHTPVQPVPSARFQSDCRVVFLKTRLLDRMNLVRTILPDHLIS
jgi:hypothetical protein